MGGGRGASSIVAYYIIVTSVVTYATFIHDDFRFEFLRAFRMKLNSISRHDLDGLCNTADLLVEPGRRVLAVIRDSLPGAVTQEAQVRELTGLGHVVHLSRVNQRSRKRKGYWADAWLGDTDPIENTPPPPPPPHTHTHTHTHKPCVPLTTPIPWRSLCSHL